MLACLKALYLVIENHIVSPFFIKISFLDAFSGKHPFLIDGEATRPCSK